jgi:hypothetical protein
LSNDLFLDKFKWVVLGGVVAILLAFGGLIFALTMTGRSNEKAEDSSLAGEVATESPAAGDPERTETAPSQSFEGTGKKSQTFKAGGGLTVIKLAHRGSSNFVVLYGQGQANQLLVNEVGKYEGSRALGLPAGDYTLEIDTAGEWAVSIDQSVPTTAEAPPQKLSGTGQAATKFFALKPGTASFRVSHEGAGLFAPYLLKADGKGLTNLANELGKFSGEKKVDITEEGVYVVDVSATGPWSIDVSQ